MLIIRVYMLGWREAGREGNTMPQCHVVEDGTRPDDPADFGRVVEESTTRRVQAAPSALQNAYGLLNDAACPGVHVIIPGFLVTLGVREGNHQPVLEVVATVACWLLPKTHQTRIRD